MKVWIDQDLCTGDGLCTDHAPAVFTLLEDGIAYVKQAERVLNDPGSSGSLASVPPALEHDVVQAADDCPGECIFIEWIGEAPPPAAPESNGHQIGLSGSSGK
jgi:ferredoxin